MGRAGGGWKFGPVAERSLNFRPQRFSLQRRYRWLFSSVIPIIRPVLLFHFLGESVRSWPRAVFHPLRCGCNCTRIWVTRFYRFRGLTGLPRDVAPSERILALDVEKGRGALLVSSVTGHHASILPEVAHRRRIDGQRPVLADRRPPPEILRNPRETKSTPGVSSLR